MNRLALYRAYRPADLSDVVGQAHIVESLEAGLKAKRIAHAYLLTGPRGVGKTSVARILARRVNGLSAEHDLNSELDIIEIDAASNRGIDEIRALRDKIAITPSSLKYKVFIIDEVHMLTREAFNALLKTLEEPPAHAVFVLATTEAHKLPDTVISRTQRYDFRPVKAADMVEHLGIIAKKEQIAIDQPALELIARLARGGFRDALSLLDQFSSHTAKVTQQQVASLAGIGDEQRLWEILTQACSGQIDEALVSLGGLWEQGAEPTLVLEHMLLMAREVFLVGDVGDANAALARPQLATILSELSVAASSQRTSLIPSLPLELALWRLSGGRVTSTTRSSAPAVAQTAPPAPSTTLAKRVAPVRAAEQQAAATQNMQASSLTPELITTKALSLIKAKNNSLYAILRTGEPHFDGQTITIKIRFRFHKERIEEHKNRVLIESIFRTVAGQPVEMVVVHMDDDKTAANAPAEEELVASALEILGGEVIND